MSKTLKCKTHPKQPRYGCALCDQAALALVKKMLRIK